MKQTKSNPLEELNDGQADVIKSIFNYPTLEKLFDPSDSNNLSVTRRKMQSTIDDLERIIRRGTKEDAEKAASAVKAFQTTLSFLDELENLRRTNSK